MSKPYDLAITGDGEHIGVLVACDPLTKDHLVRIPTAEVEEAVAVARSRQLGVDARGDL